MIKVIVHDMWAFKYNSNRIRLMLRERGIKSADNIDNAKLEEIMGRFVAKSDIDSFVADLAADAITEYENKRTWEEQGINNN